MKRSGDMKKPKQTALDDDSMSEIRFNAIKEFHDPEHRHVYCDEFLNVSIATQIKVLREQRSLTQRELAEQSEMKQSRISALEDVNYSSWSINTLRRLARAFDVTLSVHFESFGDKLSRIESFSRDSLEVPQFANDVAFATSDRPNTLNESSWAELFGTPQLTITAELEHAGTEVLTDEPTVNTLTPGGIASNLEFAEAA